MFEILQHMNLWIVHVILKIRGCRAVPAQSSIVGAAAGELAWQLVPVRWPQSA